MVKHYNLPSGMMIKTFYCHECGKKLKPHYTVKTLRKGDPEFRKNAKVGDTYILTAKEVKIYNSDSFYCDYCNKILTYENQCIIRKIQKIYNKKILSQEEIEIYFNDAKIAVDKEKKLFENRAT